MDHIIIPSGSLFAHSLSLSQLSSCYSLKGIQWPVRENGNHEGDSRSSQLGIKSKERDSRERERERDSPFLQEFPDLI